MKIQYNVPGKERKSLATAVAHELEATVKYLGPRSFAYEVGGYRIDKDGLLTGADNRHLVADLQGLHGFVLVSEEYDVSEAGAYAERELRRMKLESQNVPDHSNRGQYGGDIIPQDWENGMTEEEELGLGRRHRESFQGENGNSSDDCPEYYTYRAELSDPDWPDRFEIITATSDADAIRQAWELCTGEIVLLELHQLDENYEFVRGVDIRKTVEENELYNVLTIDVPVKGFTTEKIGNLRKLVAAKAPLLKAALDASDLSIQQNGDTLSFPWFQFTDDSATVKAYSTLVSHLCKAALEKTRVTAKERNLSGSPRYSFRCFLLSIGFIGSQYKAERKILLKNLSGSSAYSTVGISGKDKGNDFDN